jgi:hypothetical protein
MKKSILYIITLWAPFLGEKTTKFFIGKVLESSEDDPEALEKLYNDIFDVYIVRACEKFEEQHGEMIPQQREMWKTESEQLWTKTFRNMI